MRILGVFAPVVMLAGCSFVLGLEDPKLATGGDDAGVPDAGIPDAGIPDAGPPSTVHGTAINHRYTSPHAVVPVPADLTGYTIQAYSLDTTANAFRIIDGQGKADGTFTIPDVPDGPYYLFLTSASDRLPHFYETTSRTPGIGGRIRGRADGARATKPTTLTVRLTGMTPWGRGDQLSLQSFSTGVTRSIPALNDGAVALDSYKVDWSALQTPLLDPLKDDLYVLHTHSENVFPNASVRTIADVYTTRDLAMVDGTPTNVTGTFMVPPTGATQTVYLSPGSFLTGMDISSRRAVILSVRIRAGFAQEFAQGESVFEAWREVYPQASGRNSVEATYRDPYPSDWKRHIDEHVSYPWSYAARGTTRTATFYTDAHSQHAVTSPTFPAAPIAPARAIKVGGVDVRTATAVPFDGVKPVAVTWTTVPGISHYIVYVLRILDTGTSVDIESVAFMDTTSNAAMLPASLFSVGDSYILSVTASDGDEYRSGVLRRDWPGQSFREAPTARLLFASSCGNGAKDAAYEECDSQGATTAQCNADCTTPRCGDGILNTAAGETCDDAGDSAYCTSGCVPTSCGDGHVNPSADESCDDHGTADSDGCTSTCVVEPGYTCNGSPSVCTHT